MKVERIASFCTGNEGGNPAGVVVCEQLPEPALMQSIAAEVGYSETVFAAPFGDRWRVRYFAPDAEVAFCGHATIALGAVLALRLGDGRFALQLNDAEISVEGFQKGSALAAALQSPPTSSEPATGIQMEQALALFSLRAEELDQRISPAITCAGVRHLLLPLRSRARLGSMRYDLEAGRAFMAAERIGTINLVHAEQPQLFHSRNAFAIGGVYEDPATGAAAAALGGYLRDSGWPHGGAIEILQGEDMGMPSRIDVEIGPEAGASIRVSGAARLIAAPTAG